MERPRVSLAVGPGGVPLRDGIDGSLLRRLNESTSFKVAGATLGTAALTAASACAGHSVLLTQSALCPARALIAESAHEEMRAQLWPQLAATADLGSENRGPGPASREGRVIHVSSGDTRVPSMSLRGSYRTRRAAALGSASGDLTRQLLRTVSIQHRPGKRL